MLSIPVGVPLLECIIRISVWHQTLLADDTFLGQVYIYALTFVVIVIIVVIVVILGQPVSKGDG